MQDTTTPQNFVLYGCDLWAIVAEFESDTPNALVSELARHNSFLELPESTDWSMVAALAFHGFPALILNGSENATYLLMQAPLLPFYSMNDGKLSRAFPNYFTLEQSEAASRL